MARTLLQSKVRLLAKALEYTKKEGKIEDKFYEVLMQLVKDIESLTNEPKSSRTGFQGSGAGFQDNNKGDGLSGFRG